MSSLKDLVGLKVLALIGCDDKDEDVWIEAEIISLNIQDYYFEEKNEPIYIQVNIKNLEPLPSGFDYECLIDVDLSNIRKF